MVDRTNSLPAVRLILLVKRRSRKALGWFVVDSDFDAFVGLKQGFPADLSRKGEIAERPLNLRSLLRRHT